MQERTRSQDIAGRATRPGPVLKTAWVALESFGEARQARRLASDARAGVWARGKARREQRRFLKRKWRLFTGALLAWFALVAAAAAFMPGDLLRGMVIGAGAVAGPTGIWVLLMQLTGTASTMMGDTAEQWTAQELRPLSKDGWRLINHFGLTSDDIDHLLVGAGGVFVLETKWSSTDWQSAAGRERQRRASTQAAANTRRLNLWAPFKKSGLHAQPVVVLWGADVGELTHTSTSPFADIDGTPVLLGPTLQDWLRTPHRTPVSTDGIDAVWPELLAHVAQAGPRCARTGNERVHLRQASKHQLWLTPLRGAAGDVSGPRRSEFALQILESLTSGEVYLQLNFSINRHRKFVSSRLQHLKSVVLGCKCVERIQCRVEMAYVEANLRH